jgi:hypothetical protein
MIESRQRSQYRRGAKREPGHADAPVADVVPLANRLSGVDYLAGRGCEKALGVLHPHGEVEPQRHDAKLREFAADPVDDRVIGVATQQWVRMGNDNSRHGRPHLFRTAHDAVDCALAEANFNACLSQ